MKYVGYPEPEWSREHLLERDGCSDVIREFWRESGLSPCKIMYPDPVHKHRCAVCARVYKRAQDLKTHVTKTKHIIDKPYKPAAAAVAKARTKKREEEQKQYQVVKWHEAQAANTWIFKYLGAMFQADGRQTADIERRIAMARQRHGKMRHLWRVKKLHINLRIRLYVASVCSILTYGSEAWTLTPEACRRLNGANSRMLSIITGKSQHEEASESTRTVDLVRWIRARRLQWLGHILRMDDSRLIKKAVQHLFEEPAQVGDFLMDAPQASSWDELCERAKHREAWRTRVRELKMHK